MILTNGRMHTMNATGTVVDTLVVREGRIADLQHAGDPLHVRHALGR